MEMKTHTRKSIRYKGYNYAGSGLYFITICIYKRELLFGEIINYEMNLNEIGNLVKNEWLLSESIREELTLDEFIIMPNHLHGIVQFVVHDDIQDKFSEDYASTSSSSVGAQGIAPLHSHYSARRLDIQAHSGAPLPSHSTLELDIQAHSGAPLPSHSTLELDIQAHSSAPLPSHSTRRLDIQAHSGAPLHRPPKSLGSFIAGFKATTAKSVNVGRGKLGYPVWQRNYYEHIIRNEEELYKIRNYIRGNPMKWEYDEENPNADPSNRIMTPFRNVEDD
jgi:REP element-mobilizing transposase RayT